MKTPKPIIKVDKKGKITRAPIRKSPTQQERIAKIHRDTQHALKQIERNADPSATHKRKT